MAESATKVCLSATVGQEPEIELTLVSSCLRDRALPTELRANGVLGRSANYAKLADLEPALYDPYDPSQRKGGRPYSRREKM